MNQPGHAETDVQGDGIDEESHHSEPHRHNRFNVSEKAPIDKKKKLNDSPVEIGVSRSFDTLNKFIVGDHTIIVGVHPGYNYKMLFIKIE